MRVEATAAPTVQRVDARQTAVTPAQMRAALSRAYHRATGRAPSTDTLDLLEAQASLETTGGSRMYNYNFGGIKGASPRGESATYGTREVIDGQSVHLQQGFRAYESLDEGASDYIAVLGQRFPAAFSRARAGDLDGFAHALKQAHYYTADEQQYAAGLRALAGKAPSASPMSPASLLSPMSPGSLMSGAPAAVLPASGAEGSTDYSTTGEISRLLDVVSCSAARIAEPTSDDT